MPKVCSYTVSTIACDKTLEYLQLNSVQNEDEDEDNEIVRCVCVERKEKNKQQYNFSHLQTQEMYT